ncbi:peptidoglycan/LPS O-acetylase OafA/YrhL [Jatrophihabitans sp. GAS493]|uniref:acyltransferase family protein n=1 Tax=Jatrophihabitans sp. GAS493 TaxID=1907575 RepID=UPI000BB84C8B|nr:acyltransferase [Jatrophihabitans sp. GAS493]SOD74439.1 peptidoglycan/LPS O-acetylase OafA/YrhL [Jatrophihabitans sp. GAS493]
MSRRKAAAHVEVVDGLRGIAVLLVVLFHLYLLSFWVIPIPGTGGSHTFEFIQSCGNLGVELFFFLSAFCLFYPHAKVMVNGAPVPTMRHYTYRRAIKILPSYWLCIILILLFLPDLYPISSRIGTPKDLLLHFFFLHNLFPDTRSSINLVLWSLGVEVQFYVVFPLLARAFRWKPWLTFAGMLAVAIGYRTWVRQHSLTGFDVDHWNNQLPAFFDLFAFGMLTAYLLVWVRNRGAATVALRTLFTVIGVASFALMLYGFDWLYDNRFAENAGTLWRSENRQWLAATFAGITLGFTFAATPIRRLIANPVLTFLSVISYNLYLWHQIVGLVVRDHIYRASTPTPTDDAHWRMPYFCISFGLSILTATVITYGFERPLLNRGVRGVYRQVREFFTSSRGAAAGPIEELQPAAASDFP